MVIPDLENPFFTAVVRGIELVLQAAGYTLLLANSDEDAARERNILETLRADGVAGIIFVPINAARDAYRDVLAPPLQIVAVDRSPTNLRPDLVTVDNVEGTRAGVEHLLALGHRDVALLGGPSRHSTAKERERGYEQALRAAGRPIRPELVHYGDFREGGGYDGMTALMALPRRPTAVFVANNLMTLGAFRALHEAGIRIPRGARAGRLRRHAVGHVVEPAAHRREPAVPGDRVGGRRSAARPDRPARSRHPARDPGNDAGRQGVVRRLAAPGAAEGRRRRPREQEVRRRMRFLEPRCAPD